MEKMKENPVWQVVRMKRSYGVRGQDYCIF